MRGVAVLSVLAVHAFPHWVQGGFIGVDIFFVLSGYLITSILLHALATGRFSYADFYARRVRRIFPALCLVLLACLAFGALYTYPGDLRQLGKHVAAGAAFVSNVVLWKEADYFDAASEAKPLLHLWSLGVEEQFYLLWPIVVVLCHRWRGRALAVVVGGLLVSFALNIAFVVDKPSATFFLPTSRFWELMVGASLAYLERMPSRGPLARAKEHRCGADAMAVLGLLLIVAALLLIDKADRFPGWWALLPTLGTFLLLAAGPRAWINRHLLALPILRFYGLISYPLYLWHWPLLSFPGLLGIPLAIEVRTAILIASVVLAALTYELVEKPIRLGSGGRRVPLALCVALAAIGLSGWALRASDGLLAAYPAQMRDLAAAEFRFDYADYRVDRCMLRLDVGPQGFGDDCVDRRDTRRPLLFLWGDSHAASLYPGLSKHVAAGAGHRLAQYTAARCPPLITAPHSSGRHCAQVNSLVLDRIAAERPETVVLAAHWALYGTEATRLHQHMLSLRQTIAQLQALGVQRVVVYGQLPTWRIAQPRVVLEHWRRTGDIAQRSRDHLDRASLAADAVLRQTVAGTGARFVSAVDLLCDAAGCLVSTLRDGVYRPMANDDSHLTVEGSAILVERSRVVLFGGV